MSYPEFRLRPSPEAGMNGPILSPPPFLLCDFPTFSPPLPFFLNFLPLLFPPKILTLCLFFYLSLPSALLFGCDSLQVFPSLPLFFFCCLHLSRLSHTVLFILSFLFPTFLNFWGAATIGCTPTLFPW